MSSAAHRFGRVEIGIFVLIFALRLPAENNSKYSIFKIQKSTLQN
jgi:hypothetical protein